MRADEVSGGAATGAGGPASPSFEDDLAAARSAHRAGRLQEARDLYERAIRARPRSGDANFGLGDLLARTGFVDEGVKRLARAIEIDPSRIEFRLAFADALFGAGRVDEAIKAAEAAKRIDPGSIIARCLIASCHERLNRMEDASREIDDALSIEPDAAQALVIRARIDRRQDKLDRSRSTLERMLADESISDRHRSKGEHEYGVTLDRLGEFDAAFDAFTRSGRAAKRHPGARSFDYRIVLRHIEHTRDRRDPDALARLTAEATPDGSADPIFIVGFPRSGTTLIERILGAAPDVITSDERPILKAVKYAAADQFEALDEGVVRLDRLDAGRVRDLRKVYFSEAERLVGPLEGRRLVDKLPMNIVELATINALFPRSPIIVVIRDPRDACLSAFMQDFRLNPTNHAFLEWDSTIEMYAATMKLYLEIRSDLTAPLREQRYEDLANSFESEARALYEFAGLPWGEHALRFHESAAESVVTTPSYDTVVKPVSAKSVRRWRHYAKRFKANAPALAPLLKAFGYE